LQSFQFKHLSFEDLTAAIGHRDNYDIATV